MLKKILQKTSFGIVYLLLCLTIGEVHPFTLLPMYNTFPNWAYTFYVSDSRGSLLQNDKYFTIPADGLAHLYYSICEKEGVAQGYEKETTAELKKAGEIMMETLVLNPLSPFTGDTLQLHRVCYSINEDSIQSNNIIIHEIVIEK